MSSMIASPRTFSAKVGDSISEMRTCSAMARSTSAAQMSKAALTAGIDESFSICSIIFGCHGGMLLKNKVGRPCAQSLIGFADRIRLNLHSAGEEPIGRLSGA